MVKRGKQQKDECCKMDKFKDLDRNFFFWKDSFIFTILTSFWKSNYFSSFGQYPTRLGNTKTKNCLIADTYYRD